LANRHADAADTCSYRRSDADTDAGSLRRRGELMMPHRKGKCQGSALIGALILVAVGTLLIAAFLGPIRSFLNFGGDARKLSILRSKAEGGVDLAKADLKERTRQKDFTSYQPPDVPAQVETEVCLDSDPNWNCRAGLVHWAGRDCENPAKASTCIPRFTQTADDIVLTVTYRPAPKKQGDTSSWNRSNPKVFSVISEARNSVSGERFRVEAVLQVGVLNYASITSGILKPTIREAGAATFDFLPTEWGGSVYFGKTPQTNAAGTPVPEGTPHPIRFLKGGKHLFAGPVSFADADEIKDGSNDTYYPFRRETSDSQTEMEFRMGYQSDVSPIQNQADAYDQAVAAVGSNKLELSGDHVCLKFVVGAGGTGQIWKFDCNMNTDPDPPSNGKSRLVFDPLARYKYPSGGSLPAGTLEADGAGNPPPTVYNISQYPVVVCKNSNGSPCNLHVKGVVKGKLTTVADYIHLEGDIVQHNQSLDPSAPSEDLFGAVAKNDLVIPVGVPQDGYWSHNNDIRNGVPYCFKEPPTFQSACECPNNPFNDVTNFIAPNDGDRDVALANLATNPIVEPWDGPSTGGKGIELFWKWDVTPVPQGADFITKTTDKTLTWKRNKASSLELDGSFIALNGDLSVEGLNDWDVNPVNGVAMYAKNGHVYSMDPSSPNYYYDSPTTFVRKALPMACKGVGRENIAACAAGSEIPRPLNHEIRLFGSLTTSNYSKTQIQQGSKRWGFDRRTIIEDPRLKNMPPPGFPDTGTAYVTVLSLKAYPEKSVGLSDLPAVY
jgi:hypothetical protein